ncbi:MAG: damage-control phosphatase ARMT1 family protein [Thermoplasmatota archaeon]
MRVSPECVPCLLRRVIYETELVDRSRVTAAVAAACRVFSRRYRPDRVSARLATEVHREVYRVIRSRDPYKEVKRRSNGVVLRLLPRAERLVSRSRDPLETALLCSIAGNILDFGIRPDIRGPEELFRRFRSIVREGLAVNDLPRIRRLLRPGARVVYLADNCGELLLDTLVLRELRRLGCRVALVVKGEPILTDATMEDVEGLGLRREADEVLDTGAFAVGIDLERMPPRLRRALRGADLIISKGMANFESLSGSTLGPIAYVMRSKCAPVARAAGVPLDANVIRLVGRGGPARVRSRLTASGQAR